MKAACAALMAALLAAACSEVESPPGNGSENQSAAAATAAAPAPAAPVPAAAEPAAWVLTSEGLGPLRIGMTLAEIAAAAGADSDPAAIGGPDPEACDQFRPARAPEDVLVMVEQGRLTRVSLVRDSALKTDRGIGTRAAAAEVRRAYGDALVETPHKYVETPAAYLTHWTKGGDRTKPYVEDPAARGIVYEVGRDGQVQAIHAGGPAIQYVEGCA